MNFCSWPNEFRPTELRGSKREVSILFFLFSSSLSLYLLQNQEKWERSPPKGDIFSFYTLDTWLTSCHVSPLARVRFCPETIYFVPVQVQIIFYKLSLNYFTTFKIFFKNLVFGFHRTLDAPKIKKIRLSQNLTKFF